MTVVTLTSGGELSRLACRGRRGQDSGLSVQCQRRGSVTQCPQTAVSSSERGGDDERFRERVHAANAVALRLAPVCDESRLFSEAAASDHGPAPGLAGWPGCPAAGAGRRVPPPCGLSLDTRVAPLAVPLCETFVPLPPQACDDKWAFS